MIPGRPARIACSGIARCGMALVALALVLAGACGVPAEETPRAINPEAIPDALQVQPATTAQPSQPAGPELPIYVMGKDLDGTPRLVAYPTRFDNPDPTPADLLGTLLALELSDENLSNAVPPEVDLLGYTEDDEVATVALTDGFQAQGDTLVQAVAQLVFTATELETATTVQFRIDDEVISVPTQDGTLRREVSRDDYTDLAPVQSS